MADSSRSINSLVVLTSALLLSIPGLSATAGCSSGPSAPDGGNMQGKGSISGIVSPGNAGPESVGRPEMVPGEMLVKLRKDPGSVMSLGGFSVSMVRRIGPWDDVRLYRGAAMSVEDTKAAIDTLRKRPDVVWAEPNYIARPTKTPTDPSYSLQWHYPMFNLPQAWEITTGSSSTVVAVIDTGILSSAVDGTKTHPDLEGKVIGGYDFISDAQIANDGDGRDDDPFDVGDEVNQQSSYHGTHVAGTIAAATNNGVGVAGVDWNAKLLSIRVLGVGGGTSADIADGILWSAGISVSGVPDNPNPAKVLNLSLSGEGPCGQVYQAAFDAVAAKGAIVTVAAGNNNQDANNYRPANCAGVITVGAVGPDGTRAPYSNYGSRIDIMAPGGNTAESFTVDGESYQAGVLSPLRDDTAGAFNYTFYQGTSMATPHIAGLLSLMAGMNPALTTAQALAQLRSSATKLTGAQCARPSGDECGDGLVDAAKALGVANPTPPPKPMSKPAKTYVVALFSDGMGGFDEPRSRFTLITLGSDKVPYSITNLDPGTYIAAAWSDLNDDMIVQPKEPISAVKTPVMVLADKDTSGVNIVMGADTL